MYIFSPFFSVCLVYFLLLTLSSFFFSLSFPDILMCIVQSVVIVGVVVVLVKSVWSSLGFRAWMYSPSVIINSLVFGTLALLKPHHTYTLAPVGCLCFVVFLFAEMKMAPITKRLRAVRRMGICSQPTKDRFLQTLLPFLKNHYVNR